MTPRRLVEKPVDLTGDGIGAESVEPSDRVVLVEEPVDLSGPATRTVEQRPLVEEPVDLGPSSDDAAASSDAVPAAETEQSAPSAVRPGRIRRARALDGLRGVAVLSVVIYHLFGNAMRGGYLGVDIFFVLSGFLITSLLVREYGATGRVSLGGFWTRRARRILPAAVTVLVTATAVAGLIGGDVAVKLKEQFVGSLFFVNNWVQIAQSQSYFADTTPRPFMHYWSLAIEEQFYVVWPLVFLGVMLLARRRPVRGRMLVAAVVATVIGAASAAAMVLLYRPDVDPSRVYFGSDTHVFGLLAGVVLALVITTPAADAADSWPRRIGARTAAVLGATVAPIAFVGLIVMFFVLPDTSPLTYRGGLLVACLLTAILVHNAVREDGPVPRLLSLRGLRWFGERSFSLYLWHWPAFIFARQLIDGGGNETTHSAGWVIGLVAAVVSVVLSELSYRWIETPFRRLGFRGVLRSLGGNARRMAPSAAVAGVLVVAMLAGSALGTSPDKSELEQQLDRLAQMQREANAAPPPAAPPRRGLPAGAEITAVGDSVMLASSAALNRRFPGIYIDAAVSRHYSGAEPVLADLEATGQLREFVVLGLGTNGQAFPGQLTRMIRGLGRGHKVILVVPFGPVDGIPQAAQQLIAYVKRRPNVYLAPWCSIAADHQADLGADGVHPLGPGLRFYADAVEQGLRQAVDGRADPSIRCPL
ncbi:peptidoglycan/LPS O-acetylase OafA/YrhL [Gordonia humi]|uniref:Peptidoglycan/LPS O-acetylase OafA/YrhL n=1 Tax=Gordonia humi TaxID=686429 RepID=A0A840EVL9_9ACTN|nr:peptidoglycan/LPS O-acetylase OafA/YrhL [Gordonia humi]